MRKRSKRYKAAAAKVDVQKKYSVQDAVALVKTMTAKKLDQSLDISIKLAIDPKRSEQSIRGAVSLPKGIGKARRVVVFADGDEARAAKDNGADEVGMDDLAKKIEAGWFEFDVAIALPRTMRVISKLGKVLGPQGKMPSPKAGTVTPNVAAAVKEFKAGKIEFRTDAGANVHAAIGKKSFGAEDLASNLVAFLDHLRTLRPAQAKGSFIQKVVVSTSMGPGVMLAVE